MREAVSSRFQRTITRETPKNRIDDIEILRALAIILVLMEHSQFNLYPWLNVVSFKYFRGWEGVDLFFAISGFVIARSLLPDLAAASSAVQFANSSLAFWVRRAWRLLPSAWLWIVAVLMASLFFNRSGAFGSFDANLAFAVSAILYLANLHFVLTFMRAEMGALFPFWSLSLEEQFYLLFPFLILLSGKRLPLVVGVGILLQIFIARAVDNVTPPGFFLSPFRTDALLLGVLVALWSRDATYKIFEPVFLNNRSLLSGGVFVGLAALLSLVGSPYLHLVGGFQVGLVGLISAILVFLASYNNGYFCPPGLIKKILLWFGSRSYGMYLIHIPAYFLTREIWYRLQPAHTIFTDRFAVRFTYTVAILIIVFAELNYRLVEMPMRRHGKRISDGILARGLSQQSGEAT